MLQSCCKEEADFVTHSDTTTAQASSAQTMQEARDNARADYARLLAAQATLIPQNAEEEEEEDHLIPEEALTETYNKGGYPTGSTIKNCQIQELAQRQAVNVVAIEYAMHLEKREKEGKQRLKSGIRVKLVKRAIKMFSIKSKFNVTKQTIYNCINSKRLEVWHHGTQSPVLDVEVILISFIFTAHKLCCPLDIGD
jgi:hypothetical protein